MKNPRLEIERWPTVEWFLLTRMEGCPQEPLFSYTIPKSMGKAVSKNGFETCHLLCSGVTLINATALLLST